MSCELYTSGHAFGLYTSRASYCAMAICAPFISEEEEPRAYDDGGWYLSTIPFAAVRRADVATPLFYSECPHVSETYSQEDFEDARRFISKCAMAGLDIGCSH